MNCKPGEIAIGVTAGDPFFNWALGCMVRVTTLVPGCAPDDPHWLFEPLSHSAQRAVDMGYRYVRDVCLRPIRGEEPEQIPEREPEELTA